MEYKEAKYTARDHQITVRLSPAEEEMLAELSKTAYVGKSKTEIIRIAIRVANSLHWL